MKQLKNIGLKHSFTDNKMFQMFGILYILLLHKKNTNASFPVLLMEAFIVTNSPAKELVDLI